MMRAFWVEAFVVRIHVMTSYLGVGLRVKHVPVQTMKSDVGQTTSAAGNVRVRLDRAT